MINLQDKKDCCGCHACSNVCPKQCISMQADEQGFLYPVVDRELCVDCGLCEKVCPIINQSENKKPIKVFAAKNKNEEVRRKSSSGGVFTLLAEYVLNNGGVVFGAKFDDDWNVVHSWTDTKEGIAAFRGSKYVQSTIGSTYREAKDFLTQGRKVLFSGTPCQIAGLKKYLHKEYDNLLTIDIVCHGVPSPLVWSRYLKDLNTDNEIITNINFRSKKRGWKNYSYLIQTPKVVLFDDYASKSVYLQGFSRNMILRPSCYDCPAKKGKSKSDITLGDCWGIEKMATIEDDNLGISTILLNTDKGFSIYSELDINNIPLKYDSIIENNKSIVFSARKPYCRKLFWELFPNEGLNAVTIINEKIKTNIIFRVYNKIQTHIINKYK